MARYEKINKLEEKIKEKKSQSDWYFELLERFDNDFRRSQYLSQIKELNELSQKNFDSIRKLKNNRTISDRFSSFLFGLEATTLLMDCSFVSLSNNPEASRRFLRDAKEGFAYLSSHFGHLEHYRELIGFVQEVYRELGYREFVKIAGGNDN